MSAPETDATGFASVLWGLAALDASESDPERAAGAVPHLTPGKPQEAATEPRDGASRR